MKPLPDLTDTEKMAERGRRSVLMSARNDALAELRDCYTRLNAAPIGSDMSTLAIEAKTYCDRLEEIGKLWENCDGT